MVVTTFGNLADKKDVANKLDQEAIFWREVIYKPWLSFVYQSTLDLLIETEEIISNENPVQNCFLVEKEVLLSRLLSQQVMK